jgi:hypothetical protein
MLLYQILFIILSNYSAVVGVYMVNFLGVCDLRGLVQQSAVKEFLLMSHSGFES